MTQVGNSGGKRSDKEEEEENHERTNKKILACRTHEQRLQKAAGDGERDSVLPS